MIPFAPILPQAPTYVYDDQRIEGWPVHIERKILTEHPKLWRAVLSELTCQFARIERVVPDVPLAKIQTVPIWIHLDNPANPGAAFHPGREWLVEHGQDPKMAQGIEIGNAEHFVTWSYEQPWMVMHELAHGFHFLFLKDRENNSDAIAAYDAAVASKRYERVLHVNGKTDRSYALTNKMEYFAETTEAYFGVNDFYPFLRAELKEFDPAGYTLMVSAWGEPAVRVPKG